MANLLNSEIIRTAALSASKIYNNIFNCNRLILTTYKQTHNPTTTYLPIDPYPSLKWSPKTSSSSSIEPF